MKSAYFAYGSNLDLPQLQNRCEGTVDPHGKAWLSNWTFVINSHGVATIIPSHKSEVYGFVSLLNECQFARLDRFEGVAQGFYRRTTLQIHSETVQEIEAQVYIATDSQIGVPRPGYMELIIEAAKRIGLPDYYIEGLVKRWLMTEE